jgi:hypothetical protein
VAGGAVAAGGTGKYLVVKTTVVTTGLDPASSEDGSVYEGLELTALETKVISHTGLPRVRFSQGWVSECDRSGTLLVKRLYDEIAQAQQIRAIAAKWRTADAALKTEEVAPVKGPPPRKKGPPPRRGAGAPAKGGVKSDAPAATPKPGLFSAKKDATAAAAKVAVPTSGGLFGGGAKAALAKTVPKAAPKQETEEEDSSEEDTEVSRSPM